MKAITHWVFFVFSFSLSVFINADENENLRNKYKKLCSKNDGWACLEVAATYIEDGKVVNKDFKKGRIYFKKSCDLHIADGCFNLAISHHAGKGGEVNLSLAKKYYERACEYGLKSGCDENFAFIDGIAKGEIKINKTEIKGNEIIKKFDDNSLTTFQRNLFREEYQNKPYKFEGLIHDIKTLRTMVLMLDFNNYATVEFKKDLPVAILKKDTPILIKGVLSNVGSGIAIKHSINNADLILYRK